MLVDVVYLRTNGEKRPAQEVLRAAPLRAELKVMYLCGSLHASLTFPWLGPVCQTTNWPKLGPCALRKLEGDDLVLVGEELVGMWDAQRRVPQAWWCRMVRESEGRAPTPAALPHAAALDLA